MRAGRLEKMNWTPITESSWRPTTVQMTTWKLFVTTFFRRSRYFPRVYVLFGYVNWLKQFNGFLIIRSRGNQERDSTVLLWNATRLSLIDELKSDVCFVLVNAGVETFVLLVAIEIWRASKSYLRWLGSFITGRIIYFLRVPVKLLNIVYTWTTDVHTDCWHSCSHFTQLKLRTYSFDSYRWSSFHFICNYTICYCNLLLYV